MEKDDKDFDMSDVIGGTLNLLGLNIDMAKLLSSPNEAKEQLEKLREKLKQAGGKEVLSDEEWRSGQPSISGYFRTRGILGDKEYHIGAAGTANRRKGGEKASKSPEVVEPPLDVFDEDSEIVIIAEVPGVDLTDLELAVEDEDFSLSTKPTASRHYRKRISLGTRVDTDTLKATCRNGILEIHLQKSAV